MEEKQKKTKTQKTENTKKTTKKPTTKTTKKESNISKRKEEPKLTIIHEKKEVDVQKDEPKQAKNTVQKKKQKQEKNIEPEKQKKKKVSPKQEKNIEPEKQKKKKVSPKQEENSEPKKQEKKKVNQKQKENSKTEKNKKDSSSKEEKSSKKYIDISVGAIICAIIIIGLVILNLKLGTRAYDLIHKNKNTNSEFEEDYESNISSVEEVGNVLNNNDELVTKIKEKITFAPNVTASIYNEGSFSSNNIPNNLKLILGWSTTEEGKKLKSKNENNKDIEAIEKATMAENIKNIFGPNTKYQDENFSNITVSTFSQNVQNEGIINYSNGMYTTILREETENEIVPIIYQEIQKVVKYSTKVIVYVKTAYIDVNEEKYIVYRDFSDEEFKSELLKITPEELFGENNFNQNTGEGTVTENTNNSLDSIRNKLNTYKYTFSLDQETGEYYLTKFNKALSI